MRSARHQAPGPPRPARPRPENPSRQHPCACVSVPRRIRRGTRRGCAPPRPAVKVAAHARETDFEQGIMADDVAERRVGSGGAGTVGDPARLNNQTCVRGMMGSARGGGSRRRWCRADGSMRRTPRAFITKRTRSGGRRRKSCSDQRVSRGCLRSRCGRWWVVCRRCDDPDSGPCGARRLRTAADLPRDTCVIVIHDFRQTLINVNFPWLTACRSDAQSVHAARSRQRAARTGRSSALA